MKLDDTTGADANRLPYFVTDGAGNRVAVEFAPLTEADRPELEGTDWLGAIYREVWIVHSQGVGALKLIESGQPSLILGLLNPGRVTEGDLFLRHSLLETAPALRYRRGSVSPLRGFGRVLVARLVAENYNQGASGAVLVTGRPEASDFYGRLGFAKVPNRARVYAAFPSQAEQIFAEATI